jgi:DNA (cytosine-5)-methyltransferase 1
MFKFIDLFAGIGGIRIPFEELGGECVFSSEIDKFARETYHANFGHYPSGDIEEIDPKDIPKHDLLLAGFPCQPFSQAGLGKGFEDDRGTLFFQIEKILKQHKPKVILLENVKRFKTHDKGNTFRVVKERLNRLGYKVSAEILSGKDFGVPQNRERIYIVGLKNGKSFSFPKPTCKKTSVGAILQKKIDFGPYTISDRLWEGHQRRKREHAKKGNGFGYSLFNQKSPYTNTISARYYKDGSEILIEQRGKNPRKLTPREASRLQGFPENYKIVVSNVQAYKQFGNSVCVPVVRAIAKNLRTYLHSENKSKNQSPKPYIRAA